MEIYIDQLNRRVILAKSPQRIISLVPSQTELLHYLGLEDEVVGITKFCVHPESWRQTKKIIGGTKQYHFDRIAALNPDLIIGNKEENSQIEIEKLALKYPVWLSDILTLEDAFDMILKIGVLVNRVEKSEKLVADLKNAFAKLKVKRTQKAAYFIWRKPYMIAANDTFINEMLKIAGFENVFADKKRYPAITLAELSETQPEVILLSSEPFPFQEKHFEEFQKACPNATILLADGELFSWYGNRLLESAERFLVGHYQK